MQRTVTGCNRFTRDREIHCGDAGEAVSGAVAGRDLAGGSFAEAHHREKHREHLGVIEVVLPVACDKHSRL